MLDFNFSEMAVVALVALIVIGPKDLPKALRVLGYWVGKARGVARQFRAGFDEMVREAELAEMEKKWKEENERIMREHPMLTPAQPVASDPVLPDAPGSQSGASEFPGSQVSPAEPASSGVHHRSAETDEPVMVERPTIVAAPVTSPAPPQDKAAS
ncbi:MULTISPECIES: Sec-independent protein translocase protein TatB [unclassified Sphingomonas]|uniref:Sec-independent protein translocase protein TatB n=1 Tax=unclassified Sphingomonas TaxID=196159 RepID=UPI001D101C91|nr:MULTISPECIES: Sec-independent protein translocase protein TatB [unclassified Sphingomonas]MCC2979163.1 Sec-independent protein translocase protein TatB [Sphingomonas sp. IC4-52]MCD2315603.1 Sec-independent protein translocase protein TatB [Sphingomonas sp. IC-11]